MIVPKLYGRLGNQAFQISCAIAHAKKMNTAWAITRATQNMQYWPNYFLKEVSKANICTNHFADLYNEKKHSFDELPRNKNLCINGYFQSEKYFLDAKEDIGNALGFHCKKQEYIAIHVRRGDYVTQFSDKHPPLDIEYYDMAIRHMVEKEQYDNFIVYSDDIAWCKKVLGGNLCWNLSYSTIKDPLTDMRDMYNAAGFIISNSTFSLWPALLRLDNPVTIAPAESRWFGPGNSHLETCDLMPERFIKI